MANKIQGGVTSFLNNVYEQNKYSFRIVAIDQAPTAGNNPSIVLGYTGSNLTTITKTIDGVSYVKTLSYTGDSLTNISAWVQQ